VPVILLTAPPLADAAAEDRAVTSLAAKVAEALCLADEDVVVTLVHAAPARPSLQTTAWPIVVCHGRRRDAPAMAAAWTRRRQRSPAHGGSTQIMSGHSGAWSTNNRRVRHAESSGQDDVAASVRPMLVMATSSAPDGARTFVDRRD
jgi:hypothetical protein